MSETIQGATGEPEPQLTLAEEVVRAVEQLSNFEIKPNAVKELQKKEHVRVRTRLVMEGIPEGAGLEAGILLADRWHPELELTKGHKSPRLLERLNGIDEQVRQNRGQTVLWLSTEPEPASSRGRIPDVNPMRYFLNLGILTENAKISSDLSGDFTIPLDSYVSVRIYGDTADTLPDLYSGEIVVQLLQDLKFEVKKPGNIQIPLDRLLDDIYAKREFIAIGNKAVDKVFEDRPIDEDPYVLWATENLLESITEEHDLEPELPPAA